LATFQDFLAKIKSPYAQKLVKIEIMDETETILSTITPKLISGDIQMSFDNGIRRTANMILDNSEFEFTPDVDNLWINTRFKLYTGLAMDDGTEYYVPRGIFLNSEVEITSNFSETVSTIGIYDKMATLNGELLGVLEAPYIIDVGSDISDVLTQLLLDAGEVKPPIIDPSIIGETTPFTIATTAGQTYYDIILSLCNMLTYTFFFDNLGFPRFQPPTDLENSGSVWDYDITQINYLGAQRRYAFPEIHNYVVVVGDNIDSTIIKATASDTNPTSNTRIALIGKRTMVIEDSNIYNISLASQRAEYELSKAIAMIETINATSIPVDIIYPDDVITITDPAISLTGDRYLVKSVSFPLTTDGTMSLSLWKQRSLS
jgi:hypothetical protein